MRKPINGYKPSTFDLGLMRVEVKLESYTPVDNGKGGFDDSWTPYKTTWTFPESITNKWLIRMGQKLTGDNKFFLLRYDPNIKKDWRIWYNDLSYRVLEINDFNEGHWFLKLECEGNETDDR